MEKLRSSHSLSVVFQMPFISLNTSTALNPSLRKPCLLSAFSSPHDLIPRHSRVITPPSESTQELCPWFSKRNPSHPVLQLDSHLSHQLNAHHFWPFTPSCLILTSGITLPRKKNKTWEPQSSSFLLPCNYRFLFIIISVLLASPRSHAPSSPPQGHTETLPRTLRLEVSNNVLLPGSLSFRSSTQVICSSRVSPKACGAKVSTCSKIPAVKLFAVSGTTNCCKESTRGSSAISRMPMVEALNH